MKQLSPGQKIKVVVAGGKSHVGDVQSVSDDSIRIGKSQLIDKQDVQQILLHSPGHHGRNALFGAGIGAGIGFVLGAIAGGGKDSFVSRGEAIGVFTPFCAGLGVGMGALMPSPGAWREIYRSR